MLELSRNKRRTLLWAVSLCVGMVGVTGKVLAIDSVPFASPKRLKPVKAIGNFASVLAKDSEVAINLTPLELQNPPAQIEFTHAANLFAATPDSLNPGLQTPPADSPPTLTTLEQPNTSPPSANSLQLDFRNDTDNYGKINRLFEPTVRFRLSDQDTLRIRTGYNYFDQPDIDAVRNVPLQVGWETQIGKVRLDVAAGVDFFDHLPTAVNLNASAVVPLSPNVTLTAIVEQGPYKFNAETLNHNITAWRFGPNLYWQIDPQTSLFTLARFGTYNDGNREFQSFSRIERRINHFFIAANLFTWNYQDNVEQTSGYFSPSSFLVYTGEVGWEGAISDDLRCRLAAALGQQRLEGETSLASRLSARCTVQVNERLSADLGYTFSDVRRSLGNNDLYHNHLIEGQIRFSF